MAQSDLTLREFSCVRTVETGHRNIPGWHNQCESHMLEPYGYEGSLNADNRQHGEPGEAEPQEETKFAPLLAVLPPSIATPSSRLPAAGDASGEVTWLRLSVVFFKPSWAQRSRTILKQALDTAVQRGRLHVSDTSVASTGIYSAIEQAGPAQVLLLFGRIEKDVFVVEPDGALSSGFTASTDDFVDQLSGFNTQHSSEPVQCVVMTDLWLPTVRQLLDVVDCCIRPFSNVRSLACAA